MFVLEVHWTMLLSMVAFRSNYPEKDLVIGTGNSDTHNYYKDEA